MRDHTERKKVRSSAEGIIKAQIAEIEQMTLHLKTCQPMIRELETCDVIVGALEYVEKAVTAIKKEQDAAL